MRYGDGQPVRTGDKVLLWRDRAGTVVCSFDSPEFSERFSKRDWGHMEDGVLVQDATGELFHLRSPDEDFERIAEPIG